MKPLALFTLMVLTGCATVQPSRSLTTADDHRRFGLEEHVIAPWEDGLRTDPGPGNYEWWYFDAHLGDGSTLVVVFFTKPITGTDGPLRPMVQFDLDRPDGTRVSRTIEFPADQFHASKERCDVTIGKNRFQGDLHEYRIELDTPELTLDLTLTGEVKPWRPAAGVLGFGAKDERYFAWLPSVPQGHVTGTFSAGGGPRVDFTGTGYHDHNWGNASLTELIHDWYWGRARVGAYSVIAAFITAEQRYSSTQFPMLLLAKGDEVLVGDGAGLRFSSSEVTTDEVTGKPVASRLVWESVQAGKRYRVSFLRKKDLVRAPLTAGLPGFQRFLARLVGFDGAYHRFTGEVTVEALDGDTVLDAQTNAAAVWELMYLGHAP